MQEKQIFEGQVIIKANKSNPKFYNISNSIKA